MGPGAAMAAPGRNVERELRPALSAYTQPGVTAGAETIRTERRRKLLMWSFDLPAGGEPMTTAEPLTTAEPMTTAELTSMTEYNDVVVQDGRLFLGRRGREPGRRTAEVDPPGPRPSELRGQEVTQDEPHRVPAGVAAGNGRPPHTAHGTAYCAAGPPLCCAGSRSNSPSRAPRTKARHSASV